MTTDNTSFIRCAEEGYVSALAGIQHIASAEAEEEAWRIIGYDTCLEGGQYERQAAAFLEGAPTTPFFLDVGFFETHREFPLSKTHLRTRITVFLLHPFRIHSKHGRTWRDTKLAPENWIVKWVSFLMLWNKAV